MINFLGVKRRVDLTFREMTHPEQIIVAIKALTERDHQAIFTRNAVRLKLGISPEDWQSGYTSIFQAMRSDHPGGAPMIPQQYSGVIERIKREKYKLTEKGKRLFTPAQLEHTWRQSVLDSIHRYADRHNTAFITRQGLITEELPRIEKEVKTQGLTPKQTLSRVLQDLRDEHILTFTGDGRYVLLDRQIPSEREDLPNDALTEIVAANKLSFGEIEVEDKLGMSRQRRGQDKVRDRTLENYSHKCACCGTSELLIAAHISRWADDPANRGNLANLICMCKPHDALFESGYFSLSDKYDILIKPERHTGSIELLLSCLIQFRPPNIFPPDPLLLNKHRKRCGFS